METAAPNSHEYSPQALSRIARSLYTDGPILLRKLQHYRPYICPFERLLRHVPIGSTVLDVGCGAGLFGALLAGSGREPSGTGFDVASNAIALAQEMAQKVGRMYPPASLRFDRRDATAAWPAGPFDVVSVIDVMHHVPPPFQREFMKTACNAVRPGGVLLYKDMVSRPLWRAAANRMHDLLLARQWIHYAPIAEVERWASDAGMLPIHSELCNRLWYGHELRVFQRLGSKKITP